eukprot:TRINITY_DN66130_c1_g8_i1.p1 TRINITY_DN66130_c1_g8~~TRINITY_DN66130_c1_g8_i1.p1  ORF type:complete len:769 (-),score=454.54 TRINITY_DN66130_c1_g8_i1:1118-3304(-)
MIVAMDRGLGQVTVVNPESEDGRRKTKTFTYDCVFPPDSRQERIYEETVRALVDSVLDGYNGTIFAYGQTGTGKTYTMEGDMDDPDKRGIMPNSFYHIFEQVDKAAENEEFLVRMSFLEIYNDDVYDLLNQQQLRRKMEVREGADGFFVKDLSTFVVKSVDDLMKLLRKGQKARSTGATKMNAGSSRSHSVLSIIVEASVSSSPNADGDEAKNNDSSSKNEDDSRRYRVGKLNLVDLAGSERQKKTNASGDRLQEAKSINLSLAALGNVIKALVDAKKTHVPFRDSKLTRLLQDSLGGNTKTVMIANVGPSVFNYDETMSTLRYANRAKNIKNKPTINEDPKDALLRQFQEELAELKRKLAAKRGMMGNHDMSAAEQQAMLRQHSQRLQQMGDSRSLSRSGSMEQIIEERIVEKLVVKDTGISEADVEELKRKAEAAKVALEHASKEEKSRLEAAKKAAEEAAAMAEKELMAKIAIEEEERLQLEEMEKAIREKQDSLLKGGVAMDQAMKQKAELERTEAELRQRREEEEKLKQQLAQAEEDELLMDRQYKSREEELVKKTKKLKKLWQKCQDNKADIEDLEDEWALEKEELVDTIRGLDRELKLKQMILESFIPAHYIEKIEQVSHWNEYLDSWEIPGYQYAGNNVDRPESRGGTAGGNGAGGGGAVPSNMMYGSNFDPASVTNGGSNRARMAAAAAAAANAKNRPRFMTYGKSKSKKSKKSKRSSQ